MRAADQLAVRRLNHRHMSITDETRFCVPGREPSTRAYVGQWHSRTTSSPGSRCLAPQPLAAWCWWSQPSAPWRGTPARRLSRNPSRAIRGRPTRSGGRDCPRRRRRRTGVALAWTGNELVSLGGAVPGVGRPARDGYAFDPAHRTMEPHPARPRTGQNRCLRRVDGKRGAARRRIRPRRTAARERRTRPRYEHLAADRHAALPPTDSRGQGLDGPHADRLGRRPCRFARQPVRSGVRARHEPVAPHRRCADHR